MHESLTKPPGQELTSWKEIAEQLGVTVRTAQAWEEKRGLPVRRLPGPRSRVSTTVSALESWKRTAPAATAPDSFPMEGANQAPAHHWRRTVWVLGALALLVFFVTGIRGLMVAGRPAAFRVEHDKLLILDEHGRELWRKVLPGLDAGSYVDDGTRFVWIGDLAGDGHTEVLFVPRLHGVAAGIGPLVCYSSSGQELWRFVPDSIVRTPREEFPPPYWTSVFAVAPLGPHGAPRVLVISRHHLYYPVQVALLAPDGRVLREYWHAGHLREALIYDLDGDGRPEIILGGISNGGKAATLVVLDSDTFAGASTEQNPDYQLLGFPRGVEKTRILFPRTCVSKVLEEPYNFVTELYPEQDGIAVGVAERAGPEEPVVYYHLNRQLQLRHVEASTHFERVHAQLHASGTLDHAYALLNSA